MTGEPDSGAPARCFLIAFVVGAVTLASLQHPLIRPVRAGLVRLYGLGAARATMRRRLGPSSEPMTAEDENQLFIG
jgi:hypothetical protein